MAHEDYVSILRVPNETTANLIKGVLESEGIHCLVHSHQVPWMDSIMVMAEGFWGDILVEKSEAERALRILEEYQNASQEQGCSEEENQ